MNYLPKWQLDLKPIPTGNAFSEDFHLFVVVFVFSFFVQHLTENKVTATFFYGCHVLHYVAIVAEEFISWIIFFLCQFLLKRKQTNKGKCIENVYIFVIKQLPAEKIEFKDRSTMITAATVNMFISWSTDMEVNKKMFVSKSGDMVVNKEM